VFVRKFDHAIVVSDDENLAGAEGNCRRNIPVTDLHAARLRFLDDECIG